MFTLLYNYTPSLVCILKDEMSRFLTGVSIFFKEECHTTMLHNEMNICRHKVYDQSIKESKLNRLGRDLKIGRFEF